MNFYGSTDFQTVLSTIEHAIYANDIQVLCIDNLQFMLSNQAEGYQKFDLQDRVISELRNIATR